MKMIIHLSLVFSLLAAPFQQVEGQGCSGWLGALSPGNDINTDMICALVTATWLVRYDRVDHCATHANSSIRIVMGGGYTIDYPYVEVGLANNEVHLLSALTRKIQLNATLTYPARRDLCRYQFEAYLVVNGEQCLVSKQSQLLLSLNNKQDSLMVNETVTSVIIFHICENDAAT